MEVLPDNGTLQNNKPAQTQSPIFKEVMNIFEQYLNTPVFAFDIETDTSKYHWHTERGLSYPADITHISFYAEGLDPLVFSAVSEVNQYTYLHFNKETLGFQEVDGECLIWNFSPEEYQFIIDMFSRENYTAIAHNLVFDARQIFGKFKINIPRSATFWDTLAIHIFGAWSDTIDTEDEAEETEKIRQSFTLFNLTKQWLTEEEQSWWSSFKGQRGNLTKLITDEKKRNKLGIDMEEIDHYVAIDSIQAFRLYQWQYDQIYNHGYEAVVDEDNKFVTESMVDLLQKELDYTKLCVEMAKEGIVANIDYLCEEMVKYIGLWKENLEKLGLTFETEQLFRTRSWQQEYISGMIGEFPGDPQIQEDNQLLTKTGNWSFNKNALKYYMSTYKELIYFRYHADLETKIEQIENLLRHAEYDGRIHPLLSRLTVTGRNAGSSPNTQNLQMKQKNRYAEDAPVKAPGTDVGYLIGAPDRVLISLDCSNAENWMGAMYGRDDALASACAAEDFHTVMASTAYFADKWDSWDAAERKRWRDFGKIITFGTSYGMGQKKLARSLAVSETEAKQFLDNKDRKFWRVKQAKDRSSQFATQNGYTILWTGRRVAIRKWEGQYKGYTAWNSLAQGGVGEMIVRGMLSIAEYFKDNNYNSRVVTQVHDEIVMEIDPNEYQEIIVPIIEILSSVIPSIWNSRTTPHTRWLFTLDNLENAHKWGYHPYIDYALPLDHYVNAWGFHEYAQGEKEAPTWINQWGYGELALQKELGHIEEIPEVEVIEELNWTELRDTLANAYTILGNPVEVNQRLFLFPDNIYVMQDLFHKKGDKNYLQILEKLDELSAVMEKYNSWRTLP